ncbi:hypothetical protein THAOC_13465 [Thalassiosira oceanica]|uniref:Uncharacterized protein n=1 Tax=Thalassiosira oceanica TaxID=159749 RepID=K0SXE7_THAOC|nr:hypothetical protein THAOC_13465 [Thalassiosira oceanica]|eukprot:EJK65651.1 hypothetical protein THAOC_13465 [Thalassiosira oceanica]
MSFEPLLSAEPRPQDRSEHVKGLCLGDGRRRRGRRGVREERVYMFLTATCLLWLVLDCARASALAAWLAAALAALAQGGRPARGPEARGPEKSPSGLAEAERSRRVGEGGEVVRHVPYNSSVSNQTLLDRQLPPLLASCGLGLRALWHSWPEP